MSGHSKWATTKRQKAVTDARRGSLFTKISNQIAIAARGGTDPATNSSLALAIDKARAANMPNANIQRAIDRISDKTSAQLIGETYEAYGPSGIGIIIEITTDNKNRTLPIVKNTLAKNGGRIADPGSVMFQFKRKGVLFIAEKGEDTLLSVLDAGAEDATEEDDGILVYTAPKDLMKIRAALQSAGFTVKNAGLEYIPTVTVPVSDVGVREKILKLLDAIDDLDDVSGLFTNADL
jgi:YebC/PmpR family DNA-binding regulatory protein